MKKINKIVLILSFFILVIACSALSMFSVGAEYCWSLVAMNPWNGVEGIAFTIGYFLHTGGTVTYTITIGLLILMWWRLYALLNRIPALNKEENENI